MPTKTTTTKPATDPQLEAFRLRQLRLEQARARQLLEWRRAEFDIELFIKLTSPKLDPVPHLGPLDDVLNASMKRPLIALVECAPRHGKTVRLLHQAARRLKYHPTDQVAYASYSSGFANRKSREVRKICARAGVWTAEPQARTRERTARHERFKDPAAAVAYWQTQQGGAFVAGGRGGGYVGEGFHLILVDDPFKNRLEADSATISDSVFEDLFQGTLYTRLEPTGSMIITHQAWNDEDLIARVRELLTKEGAPHEVVSLPAVARARYDQRGRLVGGKVLWKARYPLPRLRQIQAAIGSYNFESQYQCNRVSKGTRVFQEPQAYQAPNYEHALIGISCDPGIVENVKRDESAYVVAAGYLDKMGNVCMDVLLAEEHHEEIPETVDRLELLYTQHGGAPIVLEEVSAFKSISQMARRLDQERVRRGEGAARLPINSWVPRGSKLIRAQAAAAGVQFGRVRVPHEAPWLAAYKQRLRRFTGREGGTDGLVDATVQLYDWFELRLGTSRVKARTGGQRQISAGAW
jgi:hypothetical protein